MNKITINGRIIPIRKWYHFIFIWMQVYYFKGEHIVFRYIPKIKSSIYVKYDVQDGLEYLSRFLEEKDNE